MGKFSWFGVTDALTLFKRRSEAACADAREIGAHLEEHLSALAELFALEIREYLRVQTVRVLLCLAAVFVLCVAYLGMWISIAALLAEYTGWVAAAGISCAANLLAALLLFFFASKTRPGALAPDTVKEVQNDLQCLRLLLQHDHQKPTR